MYRLLAKAFQFLIPYLKLVLLFFISIFILKIAESILLLFYEDFHVFHILISGFYSCILACSLFSLSLLPLYTLIRWVSKKGAIITSAFAFSIIIFMELGLSIYAIKTGKLLDNEIIIRPFYETLITIHGTIHVAWGLLILVSILSVFMFFAFRFQKKKVATVYLISIFMISIIGSCLIFINKTSSLLKSNNTPLIQNYIANKSWYCIQSCIKYVSINFEKSLYKETKITYNPTIINAYMDEFPNRNVPDSLYPLEREDAIPNVLGSYFRESKTMPNIVLIIVESLGREWSKDNSDGISFTPFLDSMTETGLYWKNCISTTSRSFGAIPAITGSLPYGMKGFQFGTMPQHNSLISILNYNNYQTNAFYGGDFTFDCIYEYLVAQKIDYMSPFYQEYINNKSEEKKGNWWGYFDDVMFQKSMEVLNNQSDTENLFNLFVTITAHEDLKLNDGNKQQTYVSQAKELITKLPKEKQKKYHKHLLRLAATLYTDDCLRHFFQSYALRADFKNTLFIITGDHDSGLETKNRLSYHHVPLLIWSPLLKTNKSFPAVVTHNDITPSLISLLKHNYQLKTPNYVHWISDGLDTSASFRMQSKMLFLTYSREIRELLYNNYYYHNTNQYENEALYIIDENLSMKACTNDSLLKSMRKKLGVYKYINNYTYHLDRLSKHPVYKEDKYTLLHQVSIKNPILCITPAIQPDEKHFKTYAVLKPTSISTDTLKKVKVRLQAKVRFNVHLFADEYMDLVFLAESESLKYSIQYKDKIAKFIANESIEKDTWYTLDISKEFLVKNAMYFNFSIYVSTVVYNNDWVPNSQLILKDININIEGLP